MDRQDFEGLDKAELLIAIEKVRPGLSFPETASREDLIQYLVGLIPTDPNEDGDNRLGVGVRSTLYAKAEPSSREVGVISKFLPLVARPGTHPSMIRKLSRVRKLHPLASIGSFRNPRIST